MQVVMVYEDRSVEGFLLKDGTKLWSLRPEKSDADSQKSKTVLWETSGEFLYLLLDGNLRHVDCRNGKCLWSVSMGEKEVHSLKMAGHDILVNTRNSLFCLNGISGNSNWSELVASCGFVYDIGKDYVYSCNHLNGHSVVVKRRLSDGRLIWSRKLEAKGERCYGLIAITRNYVLLSQGPDIEEDKGDLACVEKASGNVIWSKEKPAYYLWSSESSDIALLAAERPDNEDTDGASFLLLDGLDATTGKTLWSRNTEYYSHLPIELEKGLLLYSYSESEPGGQAFLIDLQSGRPFWQRKVESAHSGGSSIRLQAVRCSVLCNRLVVDVTEPFSKYLEIIETSQGETVGRIEEKSSK